MEDTNKRAEVTNKRAILWIKPEDCDPPHAASEEKALKFVEKFRQAGFDDSHPALIGYPFNGRIQLLSGSHRWAAAKETGILLPVSIWLRSDIESAWGDLELWSKVMRQLPVHEFTKDVMEGKYEQHGEMDFDDVDDANVPCNIFLRPSKEDPDLPEEGWSLTADLFMPRKGLADGMFRFYSKDREVLVAMAQKYWRPLYEVALELLELKPSSPDGSATFYYWRK